MKKIILAFACLLTCHVSLHSQSLYGITYGGGTGAGGTINKFVPASDQLTVVKSFQKQGANPYYTNLIQASNGKLYGMTFNGGASDVGIIFSYDPVTSAYNKLYDFDITNGSSPEGSLINGSDGKLYGMTSFGGNLNVGVIFSFDPSSSTYTKLYDFDNTTGANPEGSLLQTSDGKMYGMTTQGGANNLGVIFSFDPLSNSFAVLKNFDDVNGAIPTGNLVATSNGLLYGMTVNGGINGAGVIFSFNPTDSGYQKLRDFESGSGYYPYGTLMQAADGKLYGMTFKGGNNNSGVIFSFNTQGGIYTKLNDFDSTGGRDPFGNLIQANDGKLYGMTSDGGSNNLGVIFSFDPTNSIFSKLKDFNKADGSSPFGSLIQVADGKFYGLTFQGGNSDIGVMFSFDPSSNTYKKLEDFGADVNGHKPSASLVRARNGKLYGMNTFGGTFNLGVIFSLDPITSVYSPLINFDSINGSNPYGSLIQASDGKLYGMTSKGGNNNGGIIFSFDPQTLTFTKLNDLNKDDGDNPYGSLTEASDGKLYGLTSNDGKFGYGSIISYDPFSSSFSKLEDFDYINGGNPYGSLVQAADGKLYGVTSAGGNGYIIRNDTTGAGVIFSIDPLKLIYKKIKDFNYYNDGGYPYGSLIKATDGKLYGMTNSGGINNAGVIFSFDPKRSTFNKLNDFDDFNGANPYGNLMQAGDGKLYGMTFDGGINNFGVIFSFDPASSFFNKLIDFDAANGANPYLGSAFIEVPESGPLPVTLLSFTGKNNGNTNELTWKVSGEQNLDYYALERSSDGQTFTERFEIKAFGQSSYSYNDNITDAASPVYYYRLKSVDADGNFKYSNIIQLRNGYNKYFVMANPNPFKDRLQLTIASPSTDKVTFLLTDISGRQLLKKNKQIFSGTNVVSIDEINNLTKGIYMLTISWPNQSQTIKVIKGN